MSTPAQTVTIQRGTAQTAAIQRGTARSLKSRPLFKKVILWGGLILLLVVATIYYAGYRNGSGAECGDKHQCTAERNEKVLVPEGKMACFDSTFWENISQLGFATSYKGSEWNEFSCTKEQVLIGACTQRARDAFRFNPKGETRIPKYWFAPAGTKSC